MKDQNSRLSITSAFVLSLGLVIGLGSLGYLLSAAAIEYRGLERTVTVKGLSVREFPADVVIWPIQFTTASNELGELYRSVEKNTGLIQGFLADNGIPEKAITIAEPAIVDKSAQQYGGGTPAPFRYTATQSVTVYTREIDLVARAKAKLSELGKQGIVFNGTNYESKTEYLFTSLNEVKPQMIEEATQNAREVAQKFAGDSKSQLGKIKSASQGQFSISARDKNNPHIKKVRVVSTVQYYLVD